MRRWLVLVVVLAGCAGHGGTLRPPSPTASTTPTVRSVTPADAQVLADADLATILDVRGPDEFDVGHLPGALLVDFEGPGFDAAVADLPRQATYVVYSNGDARAISAAERLLALGFSDVRDLVGGLDAWVTAGYAVE